MTETPLDVPTSVAAGEPVYLGGAALATVQLYSADNVDGTFQLEGRIGAHGTWTPIGSAVVGGAAPLSSLVDVAAAVTYLRVSTTAYASGTPEAIVGSRGVEI